MACKDCFGSCSEVTSDKCVKYTGEPIPALGLCTGDPISKFEEVIIDKVTQYALGDGIDLSSIELGCDYLQDLLGRDDQNLKNVLNILVKANCSLHDIVSQIQAELAKKAVYNLDCLDIAPEDATSEAVIIQSIINKLCAVSNGFDEVQADYVKASQLNQLIADYLNSISGGGDTAVQWNTRMVPYIAYPYHGPTANFDANGIGYQNLGFSNVYICNGLNGTPDYRGRSPIGANLNIAGSALDSATNPSLPENSAYGFNIGDKKGNYTQALTSAQNGPHTHAVTDPGHYHFVANSDDSSGGLSASNYLAKSQQNVGSDTKYILNGTSTTPSLARTSTVKSGVTVNSSGSGTPHNSLTPSIGALFIMFIPS